MEIIKYRFDRLAIVAGLAASLNFVDAQTAAVGGFDNIKPVQSAQSDSAVSAVAQNTGAFPGNLPDALAMAGRR